ncbi:MAG: hypothetical protein RI907_314 [Pseudomonadota bacterium]|jgi:hypothetical protein
MRRSRYTLVLWVVATVGMGLASRAFPWLFPSVLEKYPGDALWAQMVYWLVAWCAPAMGVAQVALAAFAFACADEFSQLYQAPWLNQVRATTLGHLVLGAHFSWWDLLAYACGILIVLPIDRLCLRRSPSVDSVH